MAQASKKAQATTAPVAPVVAPTAAPSTLTSIVAPKAAPRANTARAACYTYLQANLGAPRATILAGLKATETQWHLTNGRVVKGVNPSGWLVLFSAKFSG